MREWDAGKVLVKSRTQETTKEGARTLFVLARLIKLAFLFTALGIG